ncbi:MULTISPECIES: hypothetical protein [Vibrio]|uniref:hypothetical protein n=1 Tax=Vibrio TaxID=662 RepID=UPI0005ED4581|nr:MULTISPECIES: hypothetical protein [Vibrio]HBK5920270.1 hypothetical protein [Vibrio alginolyticus]EHU4955188.1 hypothetical protein [Vibrio parahaemolyticus]EIE7517198.1 hypothetical protein [Vibrio parahaemolyticus]EJG0890027.1 hypothetical protein [Vibrio parahaemolyticus]EKA7387427.1 hypothetical protein [Vibrio parahaemolyticus]
MKRLIPILLALSASTQAENLKLSCFFDHDYTRPNGMNIEVNLFNDEITVKDSMTKHTSNYEIKKKSPNSYTGLIYYSAFQNHVVLTKLNGAEYSLASAQTEGGLLNSASYYYCK